MLIEGDLQEIAEGTVIGGERTSVEYIKVDGKRHHDIKFDNYIGTALKSALNDDAPVSLSVLNSTIVSIKRGNGEVSRVKMSVGYYNFYNFIMMGFVFGIGGLMLSAIFGFMAESMAAFVTVYFLIIAVGVWTVVEKSSAYKKARDAFGEDT